MIGSRSGAMAVCALLMPGGCDGPTPSGPLPVHAIIGEIGTGPGQFFYPRAMDTDGQSLWVIDKSARVQRIDPRTGRAMPGGWTMPEFQLGKPTGVTIAPGPDGSDHVYVPDTHYFRVLVYRPGEPSQLVASFGEYGHGAGQFIYPTDVAVLVGADGRPERIYVGEYGGNDRISVFSPDHRFEFQIGTHGTGQGVEFHRPQAIEIDAKRRELIVADHSNHRIGRLTLDGDLIAWYGDPSGPTAAPGGFNYPIGLELLGDGTALVAEFGNSRVQWIDLSSGESLGVFGVPGEKVGQLLTPWAVAVVGPDMYILDSGNNRIQVCRLPRGE